MLLNNITIIFLYTCIQNAKVYDYVICVNIYEVYNKHIFELFNMTMICKVKHLFSIINYILTHCIIIQYKLFLNNCLTFVL